jgi:integrase/recombinase XerC
VFEELEPTDVRHFIAARLQSVGTTSYASALASALRAYFRYQITCGDNVHGLLGVIASPAHWGLASLPRALKVDEIKRLLDSFTSSLPFPKRGLAIVRCLLDMGLRCSAKSPNSNWPTSTGVPAQSLSGTPSHTARTSCRCPPSPGRGAG